VQTITAHNREEYFAKSKQFSADPVDRVLSLMKSVEIDHHNTAAAKRSRANAVVNNWLAIDIYPEYRMEESETFRFLNDLLTKFEEFPF
jgi:hypothetical protein